jgi:hypothetical protein
MASQNLVVLRSLMLASSGRSSKVYFLCMVAGSTSIAPVKSNPALRNVYAYGLGLYDQILRGYEPIDF